MKVIPPIAITDAILSSSSVAETDHAEWSSGTTYPAGARVIKTATHKVYESVAAGNIGHDPASDAAAWITVGATNRWAMFDEAVGSATEATGSIVVTLAPGACDAIALLDTDADTVRVQSVVSGSPVYDETQTRGPGRSSLLFLDIPSDPAAVVTVTLSASGPSVPVEVGTLIVGTMIDLGLTEAGPSIGINDFSRRDTDDFGVTTVVERGWAKRMSIRSKVATDEVDAVQNRIASLRAKPALWIGEEGYDSLVIYGFFKDFSIDLPLATVSFCTLTIEGLTKATPLPATTVDWDNVTGSGKPEDGATVGAPAGTTVGSSVVEVDEDGVTRIPNLQVEQIKAGTGNSVQFFGAAFSTPVSGTGMGNWHTLCSHTVELLATGAISAQAAIGFGYTAIPPDMNVQLMIGGAVVFSCGGALGQVSIPVGGYVEDLAPGSYDVLVRFEGPSSMTAGSGNFSGTIIYS